MTKPATLLLGILLGVVTCALVIWNPLGLSAIDHALGRHEAPGVDAATLYTCGMHPQVVQQGPGQCPICGMELVPFNDMSANSSTDHDHEPPPEGAVRVDPSFLQNFAVRTEPVTTGPLALEIRTVATLAHNEESLVAINTKFEGWIENARVSNIGEHVNRGDILFEIYSPELVTTQREFLAALDFAARLRTSGAYPDAIARADSLVASARERLRHWDVTPAQIEQLEQTNQPRRTIEFVSPASGLIVGKMGDSLEGMRVSSGMAILKLADHSTLWAEAQFYEEDLRHLHEGQHVTVEVDAFPGRRWSGKIVLFRPALNPETRTLTALVEVTDPSHRLRPQMYANVIARPGGAANAILVPAQAVLHSGERSVVIVARGNGLFEPREVTLGLAADGMQQVTAGLEPGEEIVTSSQFLIDSESNLRAAIDQLLGAGHQHH